jgi:hypothetical protein
LMFKMWYASISMVYFDPSFRFKYQIFTLCYVQSIDLSFITIHLPWWICLNG